MSEVKKENFSDKFADEWKEDKYTADELIEKFNTLPINKEQKYFPEIDDDSGLKFVSDDMLDIAYQLLLVGNFRIEYDSDKKEKVYIYSKFKSLCNETKENQLYNVTDSGLSNIVKNSVASVLNSTEFSHWFRIKDNNKVNFYACIGCNYTKCPKLLAAEILNYIINGNLVEKLKEREEYRKKEFKSNYFEFEWIAENGLNDIPDDTFNLCEKLVENDFVRVLPKADKDVIEIKYIPVSCYDLYLLNGDFNKLKIKENFYDKGKWKSITRSNQKLLKYCTAYTCNYSACIYSVAGYIYYLKRTGQDEKIKQSREYYKNHKEEIDLEISKLKTEALEKQKNKKEEKISNLKNYSNRISNIDLLIRNIALINQNQFHMTLEGNDFKIIEECAESIKDEFQNMGKINNGFKKISLQNLTSEKLINGQNWKFIYDTLESDKLYIISGIQEFVDDYKLYQQYGNSSYRELRVKQFNYILKLLTNLSTNTYVILEGTQEEINKLFDLDNALKFAFQGNRYFVSETSIDEMYTEFLKNLNPIVIQQVSDNAVYKKFVDYVALNKDYMPLSNLEISSYLSNYCNMNNKIEFPDNIYKKETVDESLANIIGMENIKKKVKEFEKFVLFNVKAKALGMEIANSNLHMVFTGNPGTGKTTIARIMAKMLYDLGLIKENKLIEVERKDLVAGYIGQTATKTAEVIEKAMGGVLFIDEAYSLAPKDDSRDFGKEAIATLIKAMEDRKGEFVCIFAGYRDEMKTFIDINPGVASRIGYKFDFPDYSTEELIQIFNKKTNTMGFSLEKGIDTKLKVIFDYFIKRKAFGNGRFVDKVIQETIMKHAVSEQDDDIKLIHISDIPEIEDLINSKNSEKKSVEDTFKNIIGMQTVKEKLLQFEKYVNFQTKATEMGIELKSLSCHMVFTGNPGTGKTTVARIIAKMLFDMSVIKENKLIEVERKDLVARYIGQTAPKTYEVIEKAMGGVLFIDEAYTLSKKTGANDSFGEEAIATLIKSMEDHKGEFVVIFAGYRNEMKEFLDVNPGIRSRIGYTFDFPDYSPEELTEMFEKNVTNMGFVCDDKSIKEVLNLCEYFSKRKDFGNGRFIDKVIQAMLLKHAENSSKNIKKITIKDIPTIEEMNNVRKTNDSTASEMITNLVGMKNIKDKLKDFECYVEFVKEAKEKDLKLPSQNMHMIFTGNPGTGKTTVARIIAKMLFDLGIIHENKLIEVERKDLIAGYIGQTAPKTYDVIEKAMGGVLFIDEAYTLNQKTGVNDNFGEEAIATLIKAMEDHKGEFIVIFAGYKNEMKEFINMNPGISSRIGYVFDFEDYTREELCEIYYRNLDKIGLKLDEDAKENVVQIMNYFQNVDNIGNGRFVDKVVGETIIKHSKNKKRIIDRINKDEIPTIKEIAENLMNGKNMIDVEKITDEELRKTAIHEIGHAMVRYLKFKTPGIKIITINPEGSGTLGYVQYDISYDGNTHTKREILDRIDVSLAGLASEQVFNGNYESGGSSDLEKSTNLARRMITFYGMGNKGLAYVDKPQGEVEALIYNQVNEILQECFDETVKLIEKNKNTMERLVEYLLKNKEIDEKTFKKIITKKNSDFKVNNNPTIYY